MPDASARPAPTADLAFVGNGRCYHTMDWIRTVQGLLPPGVRVSLLTDLIDSEGHDVLVGPQDHIVNLINIDRLLLKEQSRLGDKWRNVVKLLMSPFQALVLRRYYKKQSANVYHAHTMYYMLVCALAGVPFVGTPQGSEILVRPYRSGFYRWMATRLLQKARLITVDSIAMRDGIKRLSGVDAVLIQNGVQVEALLPHAAQTHRPRVLSIRGLTDLYRIEEILTARNRSEPEQALTFIYPFWDVEYKNNLTPLMIAGDQDLGRLERAAMFSLLSETLLVISIPRSDSSPRSVYESIFAGAAVATVDAPWNRVLPACMQARLVIVDLEDPAWFATATTRAREITSQRYVPSAEALENFSQRRSMQAAIPALYGTARSAQAA